MINPRRVVLALLLAPVLAATAWASPPTDEQIDEALDAYAELTESVRSFAEYQEKMEGFRAAHAGVIDLAILDARQIETLAPILTASEASARDTLKRLADLETADTVDGFVAMVNASYIDTHLERRLPAPDRLVTIMRHPRLGDALTSGHAVSLLELLAYFGEFRPELLEPVRLTLLSMHSLFTPDAPTELALAGMDLMRAVDGVLGDSEEDERARERFRAAIASALRAARERSGADEDPFLTEILDDAIARTDGAFARGELVGHEAPELTFIWTAGGASMDGVTRLSDLRGRVVVLEFWHTEDSVSLMSFSKIRALAGRYARSPVVVLGVTSVRGRHPGENGAVIDTEGRPELEFDLMREFMTRRNITWPVAFTEQSLYNPEYGVDATPHIVLIDPEGVVRERALHPQMPQGELIEKIDAILSEFGHAVPRAPAGAPEAPEQSAPSEPAESP